MNASSTTKNYVFASPSSANGAPSFRALVAADLPKATTSAIGGISVSTGLSVSSGALSVSYGTAASTALQGNQTLFKLNNTDKTASSAASFYAPTASGTANYILASGGSGNAPSWIATTSGAFYATTANGAASFGTLPIAQGGTNNTAAPTAGGVIYSNNGTSYTCTSKSTSSNYLLRGADENNDVGWISYSSTNEANSVVYRNSSGHFSTGSILFNTTDRAVNDDVLKWTNMHTDQNIESTIFNLRINQIGNTTTEGGVSVILGNSKTSTEGGNYTGRIVLYNSNGTYGLMNGSYM